MSKQKMHEKKSLYPFSLFYLVVLSLAKKSRQYVLIQAR